MLKKTVTYTDYNGDTHTEDFYFNLTKVEYMELEYGLGDGDTLTDSIKILMNSNDMATALRIIKNIILTAYGVKSPDGKRFIKNSEVREAFMQSPVFEQIYWDLVTDAEKAAEFISGIVPSTIRESLGNNPKEELLKKMKEFEETNK